MQAVLAFILPYVAPTIAACILTGVAWLFTKGGPALIAHVKNTKIRGWLLLADQVAGTLVTGLLQPALASAQAVIAKGGTPQDAGKAALAVLVAGLKAKLGPTAWADLEKEFGDQLDQFLQHLLAGAAASTASDVGTVQTTQADAAALAAHLNAITA